jgi:hypothetical protein
MRIKLLEHVTEAGFNFQSHTMTLGKGVGWKVILCSKNQRSWMGTGLQTLSGLWTGLEMLRTGFYGSRIVRAADGTEHIVICQKVGVQVLGIFSPGRNLVIYFPRSTTKGSIPSTLWCTVGEKNKLHNVAKIYHAQNLILCITPVACYTSVTKKEGGNVLKGTL